MEESNKANLKIFFYYHYNHLERHYYYDELIIEGISYSTKKNIEINISFNELEIELGKKVCSFELNSNIKKEDKRFG